MKELIVIGCAVALFLGLGEFAEADLIGSANWVTSGGGAIVTSEVNISMVFGPGAAQPPYEDSRIFADLLLSSSDVGREFLATSSTGPYPDNGFDKFVEYLTNGSNNYLEFIFGIGGLGSYGGGTGQGESGWFGLSPDVSPDFQGYTIEALGLKINSLTIESSGPGGWTDVSLDVTLKVYDEYPSLCGGSAVASTLGTGPVYGASDLGRHLAYCLLPLGVVLILVRALRRKR